jgi:Carboxypeptidase regulatory-like domain/TonB dependent receptor
MSAQAQRIQNKWIRKKCKTCLLSLQWRRFLLHSSVLVAILLVLPLVTRHSSLLFAQTETATISGLVTDESGAVMPGAEVILTNVDRGTVQNTTANNAGIYVFANVQPGQYQVRVHKPGFKQVDFLGLIVNVQDHIEQNFRLQVGSVSESVTVEANTLNINTTDASVSTVVDRQFAANLPMNGRSFQTLIELTPGVVVTPSNPSDSGQFSINGQRTDSNYWMVDGVSANIGISSTSFAGNGVAGALPSFSVLGGTNSLVSVDALQEFRIQTSTYAPEFGRVPGGQVSIVTRSGTNNFHGTIFDYLRNDVFDANNWFAGYYGLPKPEERQNDFGGTFSGPIIKDKTFFFFSYEGLRLRLPEVTATTVPDLLARQNATPAVQPYINAYPLPNGTDDPTTGIANFNSSYSNAASLDAYSLRIDHTLTSKLSLFARYNYSPSNLIQRGSGYALSVVSPNSIKTQTGTFGVTWIVSPNINNDVRFNYSSTAASSNWYLDSFGGAVPLASLPLPSPYTDANGAFSLETISLVDGILNAGKNAHNIQRQINLVDNLSIQKGPHSLKFGVDYRHLSPQFSPAEYVQNVFFSNVPSAQLGNLLFNQIQAGLGTTLLFNNLGIFAQDTWRATPNLTVTYGLRWDVDFAPSSANGPSLIAVTGYNVNDLSNLAIAPPGTPPFHTTYGNFAPRIGLAYQLGQTPDWQFILRGGFGVFYDLVTSQVGNFLGGSYPFGATKIQFPGGTFPLSSSAAAPPPIDVASLATGTLYAFDPNLQLPYALQWNVAIEQALGKSQTISATYLGASGNRLIQSAYLVLPAFPSADLVGNTAHSNYNALQLQFQRRMSNNFQALASYTWSHSEDDASAGSALGNPANALVPSSAAASNWGSSDFDIRHAFSAALTYNIPGTRTNRFFNAISRDWSLDSVVQIRTAPPVNVYDSLIGFGYLANAYTQVRPDIVPGQPFYLNGGQYPGGKALNPNAFVPPPTDPITGAPLRQGDLGRNALRGFGAAQWDLAMHRVFPLGETVRLEFRAEMFNITNHPNFGPPVSDLSRPNFGLSTQMLNQSLNNLNLGGGALDPLYQIGGPRSMQFALKLSF